MLVACIPTGRSGNPNLLKTMMDFGALIIGNEYDRPALARLWGYKSYNAISRGVFAPQGTDILVFVVTKEKQQMLTQYEDHMDSDTLFWEGEKAHGCDRRIVERRDQIHVFYREKHHSSFTYEGRAVLRSNCLFSEQPSKFTFELVDKRVQMADMIAEIRREYGIAETEREAIVKSRIGQGMYRDRSIELWKTCSVTGFTKEDMLIASHIKPWKFSNNEERMNPYNSLLLVPTLDRLFDNGYIGFEHTGKIMLSNKVGQRDWDRIGVTTDLHLREVPAETEGFLDYHSEYIFDLAPV